MKIALLGYGKMGRMIETCALPRGDAIVARIDSSSQEWDQALSADVWIDFSHPDVALKHIKKGIESQKTMIVGTTSWHHHLPKLEPLIEASGIGFLYGANFSLGIHHFKHLIKSALEQTKEGGYDYAGIEYHHKHKVDGSGTAKEVSQIIHQLCPEKGDFSFSRVRAGEMPGTHTFILDGEHDTIEITHRVRDRKVFAEGALCAADFILDKQGVYHFDDIISQRNHHSACHSV